MVKLGEVGCFEHYTRLNLLSMCFRFHRRCQFSYMVTRRLRNHMLFRPREKRVAVKPVEGYVRLRPPLLFMFASPSMVPIPVAAQSNAWVCDRSLPQNADSNPAGGLDMSLVGVVCCQVEVPSSGWSLVQRSPTECGVCECDRGASTMRRPWPTGRLSRHKEKSSQWKQQCHGVQIILGQL